MKEELRGVLVRKDAVKPGKIIDEIHNGDLHFNTEKKNDKGTHLYSPDSDKIQYQKGIITTRA